MCTVASGWAGAGPGVGEVGSIGTVAPGPLCSVCVNRFGCRPVMLVGGLLASLGMVAASFCRSVIELYLTTGVLTGERPAGVGQGAWGLRRVRSVEEKSPVIPPPAPACLSLFPVCLPRVRR